MDRLVAGFNGEVWKLIIQIAASLTLLAVFVASAIAFVAMMFRWSNPDSTTRKFLFTLFGASALGLIVSAAGDFLRVNPQSAVDDLQVTAERQAYTAVVQSGVGESQSPSERPITVYTQIGSSSDVGKFDALKNTLSTSRFLIPGVENVRQTISTNQIRFCNPVNKSDADDLKSILEKNGFNPFQVKQVSGCSAEKNLNIVEVWLQS